ncbi:MAG: site-specific integrase [Clostridiales bacterium]|nr:site-specific integrase [Clostridiales bacterium]
MQAGEYLDKRERAAQAAQEAAEAAKILTVKQYAEKVFLPQKAVTASEKTVYSYRWTFDKYIIPAVGDRKLTEITSAQVSSFLLDYQATGAAHASVIRMYAILGSFFKMAFMDGSIDRNPMERVQRPTARKDELQRQGPEAYTEAELSNILDCLRGEPLKWQAYISLLCETGLRRGEALALQWSSIDFQTLEITVSGTLGYTPEKGIYRDTPKSGKSRVVDITPGTAALLRRLRREQAETAVSEWVFTQDNSPLPMHPDSPNRFMREFGKRHGIENFHPHKLRHSFASVAITNGADIVSVSEILGHADTAITLRTYSHANAESRKRAANVFQQAIKQDKSRSG